MYKFFRNGNVKVARALTLLMTTITLHSESSMMPALSYRKEAIKLG